LSRGTQARNHAYYQAHKQEIAAQHRQRYATDSEYRAQRCEWNAYRRRSARIKRCYGISPEQHEALLTRQGGACAICRKRSDEPLIVDHCHLTGEVRGLLCRGCNLGLGFFKDDARLMAAAIAYLARAAAAGPTPQQDRKEPNMATDETPPDGGQAYRLMRQALVVALHRHLESDDGRRNQKLRLIADKLVDKAVEGDMQAIKELLDRVDGKPGASTYGAPQVRVLRAHRLRGISPDKIIANGNGLCAVTGRSHLPRKNARRPTELRRRSRASAACRGDGLRCRWSLR
jgi:hypothetical protein